MGFIPVLLIYGYREVTSTYAISGQHNDEERSLTGTWVTDELKKALEKGYVVQRIYEVWHFDETEQYDPKTKTGGLFTDYVNTFRSTQSKQQFVVHFHW
jgi:hypothetical protein